MSSDPTKLYGDLIKAGEITEGIRHGYGEFLNTLGTVYDRAASLNKDICSFNERMMLVALGVLGISVTSLISINSKLSSNPSARIALTHYVIPAWILLTISVLTCRNAMVLALRANRSIYMEWILKLNNHHAREMVAGLKKLSNVISGDITLGSKVQPLSAVVSELEKDVQEMFASEAKRPTLDVATQRDTRSLKIQSALAVFTLQIALVLLCIAAILLVLSERLPRAAGRAFDVCGPR